MILRIIDEQLKASRYFGVFNKRSEDKIIVYYISDYLIKENKGIKIL
jgi:hypothetical protein